MRRRRRLVAIAAALHVTCATAYAVDFRDVLVSYAIASWDVNTGAPEGAIYALAQDGNGYLWLGTETGLYRFDGMRFAAWPSLSRAAIPAGAVQAILAAPDGSLWVGSGGRGGITRIHKQEVTSYAEAEGLPALPVITIVQTHLGTVCAATDGGLFCLEGTRWLKRSGADGLPDAPIWAASIDQAGAMLVATPDGLFKRARDSGSFDEITRFYDRQPQQIGKTASPSLLGFLPDIMVRSIAVSAGGELFLSDMISGFRVVRDRKALLGDLKGRGLQLLFDRGGRLWVATRGHGVWRVTHPNAPHQSIERVTRATGLVSEGAFSLLEDRDGNIWAGGTPSGLTRLTPHKFLPVSHDAVVTALSETPDGRVWVGTSDGLIDLAGAGERLDLSHRLLPQTSVRGLHVDGRGRVWVALQDRVIRINRDGSTDAVARPGGFAQIDSVTSGADGCVLVSDAEHGLFENCQDRGFAPVPMPPEAAGQRIVSIHGDTQQRVWIALSSGAIALLQPNHQVEVLGRDDFSAGAYRVIYQDRAGAVWLGGSGGITRFDGNRARTLHGTDGFPIRVVRGIVEDTLGSIWIATGSGILRVQAEQLTRALADPTFTPQYSLYDKSDGLAGLPSQLSDATAIRTKDGRLWFVTGQGMTIADPGRVTQTDVPAVATLVRAVAEDRQLEPLGGVKLVAGTSQLQIEYGALNLTAPERTRFRFRLDGVDAAWVDAGTRRQATYANLSPGSYQFHLSASSSMGAWQAADTVWAFSIEPRFYQTRWFALLCGAAVIVLSWATWTMRLRQERSRFALLLGERARLSREIHDTLLQGLVGIALQCDALANDLDAVTPEARQRFARLRRQAKGYVVEARHAIWNLRTAPPHAEELPATIRRIGDDLVRNGADSTFSVTAHGPVAALRADVSKQLVRIAHEAMINAARHANATDIRVTIDSTADSVTLRVEDNGCGFSNARPVESVGHYGIAGMRERAQTIGASFDLVTSAGQGTTVEVVLDRSRSRGVSAAAL